MTDSRLNSALAAVALAFLASACGTPAGMPKELPLQPMAGRPAHLPDNIDHAAHDLAVAALGSDPTAARAQLAQFEAMDQHRVDTGWEPSGLSAYARHLVDSTLNDAIVYRHATSELLKDDDIDPALRKQLEMEVADDPLLLAKERIGEGRQARIARDVNAFTEAVGKSLLTFVFLPVRVAQAVVKVAMAEYLDDPISLQQRQALAHWKEYVEQHPDTPEAHELVERIESMQRKWFDTKRRRSARAAKQALGHDQDTLALVLADRALRYAPEDGQATRLRDEAQRRVDHHNEELTRSLEAAPGPLLDANDPQARELMVALLGKPDEISARSDALRAANSESPLADSARFANAIALGEAGRESEMWDEMAAIAGDDPAAHPMARHARALVESTSQNPYQAFEAAQGDKARTTAGFVALGPLQNGPRDRDLPRSVEWLLEAPTLMPALGGIPWRLMQVAIAPPETKAPAVAAEQYLERYPHGEHATDLRDWLIDHESSQKHWVRAHDFASDATDVPPAELADLAQKAAEQCTEMANKQKRRDIRFAILRATAQRYPDTKAGQSAADQLRKELQESTEQSIRISRQFLIENHNVASDGLGLRPELIDGDKHNGELHPQGVRLLGGRELEISMLAESGDEDDQPRTVRQTISADRLSRLVSMLEETSGRNALLDPMAEQGADARRDLFFERARLGVADTADERPTAESSYSFVGVRERYNLVRSRESILPVEIVVSGSLPDLGFGAFPRLRQPKETPDAVFFK